MEGLQPPHRRRADSSANANAGDNHPILALVRRSRRRRIRALSLNSPKRTRAEGESSRTAAARNSPPPEDDGAGQTEAEAASQDPALLPADPAPQPKCLAHGSSSVLGRRRDMEDTVTEVTELAAGGYGYFAVYDGHGGKLVAEACRDRLHLAVAEEVRRLRAAGEGEGTEMWRRALVLGFAKVEAEVIELTLGLQLGLVGSTAVAAVVSEKWVMVANCGDSRAVLSRGGVAMPLSIDHKPDRPDEFRRVESLGGKILCWDCPRVLGVLSTSRSFGDYLLKPCVSADPEFMVTDRSEEDEFLVLASDGLWDVISSEMACRVTRRCLRGQRSNNRPNGVAAGSSATEAAAVLARLAISRGSHDNVSVVVVVL